MHSTDYAVDGIVVGGACGALGKTVVQHLLAAGRQVHAVYYQQLPSDVPAHPNLSQHCCDLSDGQAVQELLAHLIARHEGIEAVVNAAGGFTWAKTADCADTEVDFLWAANFKSAFCLTKYALPHLCSHNHGRIVLISAAATLRGGEVGMGVYLASKSALNALLLSTAAELQGSGVTINAIAPTIIDTPRNRRDMPQADFSTWVSTATVNQTITLLLSKHVGNINGALIPLAQN